MALDVGESGYIACVIVYMSMSFQLPYADISKYMENTEKRFR